MDFAVIGTLSSYVKQKNLTFAAKHKIRTGQTLTNSNGNFISTTSTFQKLTEAAKTSNDQAKQQKLRRIKQKLMNGKKISEEEMGFLRVNDPKTYKKEAREELKAELKKAESKSEAREAMTRAMIKASTEAMAELGALGQTGGVEGGGASTQSAEGTMNFAGDTSASNLADGTAAEGNVNAENQNLSDGNQSVQDAQGNSDADKNSAAQKNSDANKNLAAQKDDDDKNTPEDIMEKYIMTIRALEDEWARFTDSDEYKNLPENTLDDKKIHRQIAKPKRVFLNAAADYRKSMLYKLYTE